MTTYRAGVPISYEAPQFPSLYWPVHASPGEANYLYFLSDIYRYTVYWTLITIVAAHTCVATWAVLMQFASATQRRKYLLSAEGRALSAKNRKLLGEKPVQETVAWVWVIPVVYLVIGASEALLAGSLVGLVLGAIYNAGYFRMSTWTPLLWGVINMLVLVSHIVRATWPQAVLDMNDMKIMAASNRGTLRDGMARQTFSSKHTGNMDKYGLDREIETPEHTTISRCTTGNKGMRSGQMVVAMPKWTGSNLRSDIGQNGQSCQVKIQGSESENTEEVDTCLLF